MKRLVEILRRGLCVAALALLAWPAPGAQAAPAWGSVQVGRDRDGQLYAVLENSLIRVRYGYDDTARVHSPLTSFVIKGSNEEQAGSYLDGSSTRGALTRATVKIDALDRKTVRLEWDNGDKIQEVTIFPDQPYLQIDYLKYGIDVLDQGSPGGGGSGYYRFYGGDDWARGYVLRPDSYYNRYPGDRINDPADGGALSYRGYFIGGVYGAANDRGYARVMPVAAIDIQKLLGGRGLQAFPYHAREHVAFTGFLFAVTGGAAQIDQLGRQLVDLISPPLRTLSAAVVGQGQVSWTPAQAQYENGATVSVTAAPATGWSFTGWSGGLSGSANPAALTLAADTVVTATFTLNTYALAVDVVGQGTVTRAPDQAVYAHGSLVTLTAVPAAGWVFTGWSGDANGSAGSLLVTMLGPRSLTANFVLVPVTANQRVYLPLAVR